MLLVTVAAALTPVIAPDKRIELTEIASGISRLCLRFSFMETPDVPAALAMLPEPPKVMDTTFVLSRQTLIPSDKPGMALWREAVFAALVRNAETPTAAFRLPPNRVVELGSHAEI